MNKIAEEMLRGTEHPSALPFWHPGLASSASHHLAGGKAASAGHSLCSLPDFACPSKRAFIHSLHFQ